jgi:hypothetical protein
MRSEKSVEDHFNSAGQNPGPAPKRALVIDAGSGALRRHRLSVETGASAEDS